MRKLLFIVFIAFLYSVMYAQSYTMHVNLKGGGADSFDLSTVKKITFENVTSLEDIKQATSILENFRLSQNYPNPFNPTTTIDYDIPESGDVKVEIFDINGRMVRSLVDEKQKKGRYSVIWNGKNMHGATVANGSYFYRVKFNETYLVKKMLLIK